MLMQHLPILPIVIPLMCGAALLLIADSRHMLRNSVAAFSCVAQLVVAITLLFMANGVRPDLWPSGLGIYLLGDWWLTCSQ